MQMTRINPPGVLHHPGFTRIITVEGPMRLAWMAGQTPQTDDLGCVAPGDFKAQYEFVMDKLQIQLEAIGANWDNVVFRKLYLTDVDAFRAYSRGPDYRKYFTQMPCSTAIGVTRLSHPDFLVEVELLVALPD